ncbi:Flp pilus assembly protein CpaB [Altererythrobacter aurantiacus]|uniref:Flp pilus assembly protein CpaB n=1 Tax=Parapontixanthobacter aurantiacus TaxID=1463599 RepID=A0A844ZG93_9SPHN|nr:Flp pilus assembly protein CpaB [Parapontixanthobacter aurantiacus]MXO86000.1 Flp pilus assembly protein CpaB [Parapontixanthobacter aurantiacus]
MRGRNLAVLGIAVFLGLIAVFLANSYFSGIEARQERLAQDEAMTRIVVATQDMGFGTALAPTNMRLAAWPAASVPIGAFTSIEDATRGGRVALRPLAVGEPILSSKVSGEGGRATLSAVLPEDQRAVSIPVNEITGVAGFVRAGDVVDVMLTRQIPGDGAQGDDQFTSTVLENVLVLAIDQVASESETAPAVGKTATLQTDLYGAQKLTLANQLGNLSLALRNVENQTVGGTSPVLPSDLGSAGLYIPARNTGGGSPAPAPAPRMAQATTPAAAPAPSAPRYRGPTMQIVRGTDNETYEVNRYGR